MQIMTIWLFAGIWGMPAIAQVTSPVDAALTPEEVRRYTVEMIVFVYNDSSLAGNELFIPDAIEPSAEDAEPDGEFIFTDIPAMNTDVSQTSKTSLDEIPTVRPLDLVRLETDEYTMQDIYARLEQLDAYTPIMHTGWTQTTVERNLTSPIRLRLLGNAPLRLDGDLTLYLSRFLHLVVNLSLDADLRSQAHMSEMPLSPGFGRDSRLSNKPDIRPAPVRYRIFEDRIFKSGDLRYFDHPKFGVLAKVTRYETREPEQDRTGPMLSETQAQ